MNTDLYYIYFGLYHPVLFKSIEFDYKFFSKVEKDHIKYYNDLSEKILTSNEKDIISIYQKFINSGDEIFKNSSFMKTFNKVFVEYCRHYNGKKPTPMTMYALKTCGDQVTNVENSWDLYRKK